jgi:hypothetical protein
MWPLVRFILLTLGCLTLSSQVAGAMGPPYDAPWEQYESNESGFTLNDLLEQRLWTLVRAPQSAGILSRIDDNVHRAPARGVQFELLCPGDFGATIHIRW